MKYVSFVKVLELKHLLYQYLQKEICWFISFPVYSVNDVNCCLSLRTVIFIISKIFNMSTENEFLETNTKFPYTKLILFYVDLYTYIFNFLTQWIRFYIYIYIICNVFPYLCMLYIIILVSNIEWSTEEECQHVIATVLINKLNDFVLIHILNVTLLRIY